MTTPLVSVCLTVYQQEKYIRQCLDGALMQQTDFDFEIIIGEDGSTDGTREICKEYQAKYPDKIKLFLRSREDVIYINSKPTGRFNFIESIKAASGKYIALCEGDDYWTDPQKLSKQVAFMEKNDSFSFCFTAADKIDENGKVLGTSPVLDKDTFTIRDFGKGNIVFTATLMFRAALLQKFPFDVFRKVPVGDYFLICFLANEGQARKLDFSSAAYRVHSGSNWALRGNGYQFFNAVYIQYIIMAEIQMPAEARMAFRKGIHDFFHSLMAEKEFDFEKALAANPDPYFRVMMETLMDEYHSKSQPAADTGGSWKKLFGGKK
jgi:hypothetical protein